MALPTPAPQASKPTSKVSTANKMIKANTHLHVMTSNIETNQMGTVYMLISGQPCNNPECESEEHASRDFLWTQEHFHFTKRMVDAAAANYQEGYDDGYAHALERHGIEEVD